MPLNVPLSMLLFTFRIQLMNVAFDEHCPTRHPGMLWLFDIELNSMQHSFAPGTCRSDMGWSLSMKEYGLSLTTTIECSRANLTSRSYVCMRALPPVGMLG